MDTSIKERQIAEFCRKDLLEENQSQVIKVSCKTGRDVKNVRTSVGTYFYDESLSNILVRKKEFISEYYDGLKELLIYKANHGEIYSDILITLYPDGLNTGLMKNDFTMRNLKMLQCFHKDILIMLQLIY